MITIGGPRLKTNDPVMNAFRPKVVSSPLKKNPLLLPALLGVFAFSLTGCHLQAQPVSPQAKADFEWFGTLGFPDLKDRPFVRIATGHWSQSGKEAAKNFYKKGFLLARSDHDFSVFTTDLFDLTYVNTPKDCPEHKRIGYDSWSLKDEADEMLKSLALAKAGTGSPYEYPGRRLSKRGQAFVLAYACWNQGLPTYAEQLYDAARIFPAQEHANIKTGSFRAGLENDFSYSLYWQTIEKFGVTSVKRQQLLTLFAGIASHFPQSPDHDPAQAMAQCLRRIITEDENHRAVSPEELAKLPVEKQVSELIFQLRDQNGLQEGQPGWCNIFRDSRRSHSPADQLVAIGYPAVPRLITALRDETFTRSVGYWRDFTFSHYVLTVGDCAEAILSKIAGQRFYIPRTTSSHMSGDANPDTTQKAVQVWWDSVHSKGEAQTLIDGITSGSNTAYDQALQLQKKYPAEVPAAIMLGIPANANPMVRRHLFHVLSTSTDPRVHDFLVKEMKEASDASTRIAAAATLRAHDIPTAVQGLITELDKQLSSLAPDPELTPQTLDLLASSDSAEAMAALARTWPRLQAADRKNALQMIGGTPADFWGSWNSPPLKKSSAATLDAMEAALAVELTDDDIPTNSGEGIPVNEWAALALSKRIPVRYHFDPKASPKLRALQILEMQNVWRRKQHLPELPVPTPRTTHVERADATTVTTIDWASDSAKPDDTLIAQVAALLHARLTGQSLTAIITRYLTAPLPGSCGLMLKAQKDEDLTGVAIMIRLVPGRTPRAEDFGNILQFIKVGTRQLYSVCGDNPFGYEAAHGQWTNFAKAVDDAVASAPETPFVIDYRMFAKQP
jgi:hypothetical protein